MAPSGVAGGTVKVAAIYGSLRKGSYNRRIIRSAIELSKEAVEGVVIKEVDITSLPVLNTDLEKHGTFPAEVEAFRQKILEAESILFTSPEYNFSVTERNELGIKATQRVGRQSYRHCKLKRVARMSKRPISSSPNWNIH
ncbi:hypothetical protein K1719_013674 [Acacia pycnantha]|nr:hypothetical protein K1719_013674 [Acacia pycnantha]